MNPTLNTRALLATFVLALSAVLASCQQQAVTPPAPVANEVPAAARTDKEAFAAVAPFLTEAQAQAQTAAKKIGTGPENAVVPLVFDAKGHLVTAKEFNAAVANPELGKDFTTFYTTLSVYREVLTARIAAGSQDASRLEVAIAEHTGFVPGDKAATYFVCAFDPYQTHYGNENSLL